MKLRDNKGIGLLIMVALTAVAGLVILSSTRVFENMSRQTQVQIDQAKAHYMAQAGVMQAAWNWYTNNTTTEVSRRWAPATTTIASTNVLFKTGYDSAGSYLQSNFADVVPAGSDSASNNMIALVSSTNNQVYLAANNIVTNVPAAGFKAGNLLVICIAMDGGGGVFIFGAGNTTDTKGNTYSLAVNQDAAPNDATDVRVAIIYSYLNTALVSGDTITVRWTNNVTAKAVSIAEYAGVTTLDKVISANGTGTAATSGNTAATAFADELLVGAIGVEGIIGDTFTVGASYTTNPPTRRATANATATNNALINPEYRIVSATGAYPANGTITNRDYSAAIATFYDPGANYYNPGGANRHLRGWRVRNVHNASAITLAQMKVSWSPAGAERLTDIRLNNTSVWTGSATSGTTINVTDTALASGASWGGDGTYLQWDNNGPADPMQVTVQLIFAGDSATTDDRTNEIVLWDGLQAGGGKPTRRTFTVTSTGQVNQSTNSQYFKVLETVKATVSSSPTSPNMEIIDWDEGDKNIP